MKVMITKEQFLNGVEFTINGMGNYRFRKSQYIEDGGIEKVHRSKEGKEILVDHEANIEKITKNAITCYTSVMGEIIRKRVKFSDMKEYITQ